MHDHTYSLLSKACPKHNDHNYSRKAQSKASELRSFSCNLCNKFYKTKQTLSDHVRIKHKKQKKTSFCKCIKCSTWMPCHSSYISHLEASHNIVVSKGNFSFDTFEDFKKWKAIEERISKSFFRLNSKGRNKTYYICNRNRRLGKPKANKKRRQNLRLNSPIKMIKSKCNSNLEKKFQKMTGYCPGRIIFQQDANVINVRYFKCHHESIIHQFRLSNEHRSEIKNGSSIDNAKQIELLESEIIQMNKQILEDIKKINKLNEERNDKIKLREKLLQETNQRGA